LTTNVPICEIKPFYWSLQELRTKEEEVDLESTEIHGGRNIILYIVKIKEESVP
jgi:hypothetical protein